MNRTIESAEWRVANLDCEHDAAALKRGLADRLGIAEIDVYPKAAKVRVRFDPAATSTADRKSVV